MGTGGGTGQGSQSGGSSGNPQTFYYSGPQGSPTVWTPPPGTNTGGGKGSKSNDVPSFDPSNGAAKAPGGDDYYGWTWEQVLNGVFGFAVPSRDSVTAGRWTVTYSDSDGDPSELFIWGGTWSPKHDFLVYLNPPVMKTDGAWGTWVQSPVKPLASAVAGNYTAYPTLPDPYTFGDAAAALNDVEVYLGLTAAALYNRSTELSSEASAFKGKAGDAFHTLVNDLYSVTSGVGDQMVHPTLYSGVMLDAGEGLTNAYAVLSKAYWYWSNDPAFSPFGAIIETLLSQARPVNGKWQIQPPAGSPADKSVRFPSKWGDLAQDSTWINIENDAKNLWQQKVNSLLDMTAQFVLLGLARLYQAASAALKPITQPTLEPVIPPTLGPNGMGGGNGFGIGGIGNEIAQTNNNFAADLNALAGLFNKDIAGIGNNIGGAFGATNNNFASGVNNLAGLFNKGISGIGNGIGATNNNFGSGVNDLAGLFNKGISGVGNGIGATNSNLAGFSNGIGGAFGQQSKNLAGLSNGVASGLAGLSNGVNSGFGQQAQNLAGLGNNVASGLAGVGNNLAGNNSPLSQALANPAGNSLVNQALANPAGNSLVSQALANPGGNTSVNKALQNPPGNSVLSQALASPPNNSLLSQTLQNPPTNGLLSQAVNSPPGNSVLSQALNSPPNNSLVNQALANPPSNNLLSKALQHPPSNTPLSQALNSPPNNSVLSQALSNPGGNSVLDQALRHPGGNSVLAKALQQPGGHNLIDQALRNPSNNSPLDRALLGPPNHSRLDQALLGPPNHSRLDRALLGPPNHSALDRRLLQGSGLPNPGGAFDLKVPPLQGNHPLLSKLGQGPLFGPAGGGAGSGATLAGAGGAGAFPVSSGRFVPPAATGSAAPASSGQFAPPGAGTGLTAGQSGGAAGALGGVPFYPPMMGGMGMGMGGGGQQGQERERSTWLAEDEEVWGTDPGVGAGVLGLDVMDDEEEDTFAEYTAPRGGRTRGSQSRQGFY